MPTGLPLIQKAQISFFSDSKVAKLKQPVTSLVQASYSTVLSLADFILQHHPNLQPPSFSQTVPLQSQSQAPQHGKQFLNYNRLFEPWCDYISQLFTKNRVSQQNDICLMWDDVSDEYIQNLNLEVFEVTEKINQEIDPQLNQNSNSQSLSKNCQQKQLKKQHQQKKKIGLVNFAISQLRTDFIKPKMHLIGLFTGIFYNQGDEWKTYNALRREYPTIEEYKELDTIILSGSSLSVNDQTPQIVDFVQTLKDAVAYNPKLKILGICFGHQTLAKMFGGKIVSKKQIAGLQRIHFDTQLIHKTPYFRRTELEENMFQLSEYHKDFVVEIPQNFDIFAQSETCKIESLISKNKKYLSFQFHPEYSAEYIRGYEMRLQHYQVFDLKSSYSHTQRGSIKHNSSLWEIRKVIRNFLDWEVSLE